MKTWTVRVISDDGPNETFPLLITSYVILYIAYDRGSDKNVVVFIF